MNVSNERVPPKPEKAETAEVQRQILPHNGAHEPDQIDHEAISRRVAEAFEKVPPIGEGWRWYDFPYRLLAWFSTGWRKKLSPRRALNGFSYWISYLIPFNEHERHKVWDPSDKLSNFTVPDDEHVRMPCVWVVELFPPSEFAALQAAIGRNAWDGRHVGRESNSEMLLRSREGKGWNWWTLTEVSGLEAGRWFPDGSREKLPPEFDAIQLKAIQIGQGLTAVLARFWLTDDASEYLDRVWHAPHVPALVWGDGLPRAEQRNFAAYRITQEARYRIHAAARAWLRLRCPGFFASAGESHTLLDVLLMNGFNPLSGQRASRELDDACRALGLAEHGFLERTSPDLPMLALVPTRLSLAPALKSERTLALWGQRNAVVAASTHLDAYGSDQDHAIASRYSDAIENFLVTVAISHFLEAAEARYSALRDNARTHHGRFKPDALKKLRQHLLTQSLDLVSVREDLEQYWRQRPEHEDEAKFALDFAPHIREVDAAQGRKQFEPIDLNKQMRVQQRGDFARLIKADKDYRDIVATVASLGASMDASRMGRRALLVTVASLLVAVVTVLVANFGDDSVLRRLLDWF